jgi:large subunit ribosomal protein L21
MYAVVTSRGKQYRVAEGDVIEVPRLEAEEGSSVALDRVLLVSNGENVTVGSPEVSGAEVTATVKAHGRGKKIIVYKHFKNYHRKRGHRQDFTRLQIDKISVGA